METLFSRGLLNAPEGLVMAGLIGLAFGLWLERAGFGSSRKLTGMFFFRDLAVFQVMFSALLTAMFGLLACQALGLIELDAIYRMETFLWPQIVGGLIFGVGFVIGGWCPGTALVGLGSGKLDALVFLGGAGLGGLIYAMFDDNLAGFAASGARGLETLPETVGMRPWLLAFAILGVALLGFLVIRFTAGSRRHHGSTGDVR